MVQLLQRCMTTGKTVALTPQTFVGKAVSLCVVVVFFFQLCDLLTICHRMFSSIHVDMEERKPSFETLGDMPKRDYFLSALD